MNLIAQKKRPSIQGMTRWVVGTSEQIDIWKDRWLPTLDSFKVVSLRTTLESGKVAWLLNKEKRSWDVSKVRSSFLPHQAETIHGIPSALTC
nr:hypothetical protein CFP56_60160 [Quercus suber]